MKERSFKRAERVINGAYIPCSRCNGFGVVGETTIECPSCNGGGNLPAPLPKEVEEAMDTLHEAAYDGLCYKYHAKDNVEWWDAVLKAEVVIKAALGKQAPLPAEVEDAMGRIAGAIAGDYCHLKNAKYEKAQVEYDANRAALAVIKAAIRPKIITEE